MKYININSNRGVVNLFADYVLKSIVVNDKIDATIQITDCGKFFIINGLTNSKNIVDMNQIKLSFIEEHKELLDNLGYSQINVIDTITYGVDLKQKDEYWFTYYNSNRPIYNQRTIDLSNKITKVNYLSISNDNSVELEYGEESTDITPYFTYSPLNITSEFPHGYSFKMGRGLFYYGEYITYQLFNKVLTDKIDFKLSLKKNDRDDFDIKINCESFYHSLTIESMVLDNFNFDLNHFKSMISEYNFMDDILNPVEPKPWMIHDKKKGLVIF